MINPSDIQIEALPWLPLNAKNAFPRQPAIYFAIDSQGIVQYIGRSSDPKQRWRNHHRYDELNQIGNIRISYLFADEEILPVVEAALISWFSPALNVIGTGPMSPSELQTTPSNSGGSTIRWKLNQLMFDRGIKNADLVKATGFHANTISKLKNLREMPDRLEKATLNNLCKALGCQPADLMEYAPDEPTEDEGEISLESSGG